MALPLLGALGTLQACGGDDDDSTGTVTGAANGQKVVTRLACSACHGANYSGNDKFYPNITNDSATGIGTWSDAEIKSSIREGKGKGGEPLCSTMQRYTTSQISDSELTDVVAYLRSLSVSHEVPQECPDN